MFFSFETKGFYPVSKRESYEAAGSWPDDAVKLSDQEYADLRSGLDTGKVVVADSNGRPVLEDPPPILAAIRRESAKLAVDSAAGKARERYVSAGQLIEEEYRLTLEQTRAWRTAGSPADDIPPALQTWIDSAGLTPEQAAVDIEQTAAYWEQVLITIRNIRLTGKAAVDVADDSGDMNAIAQPYIDQLNAMQPNS